MSKITYPKNEELGQTLEFFDSQLRSGYQWKIHEEYPLVMNSKNLNNLRILKSGDQIVSGAVMKMHILKCIMGLFKVSAIGSVVTEPNSRNQGYSQRILQDCLESSEAQVCDFAILWSNLYDFYRKSGFELAGSEVSVIIQEEMNLFDPNLTIREGAQVSAEAILKVYNTHTTGTIRTVKDIEQYLKIPNSRIYTAWNQQNQIVAYAVEGKGADLVGYIHEWGGMVPDLLALFSYIRKKAGQPITVISPASAQNLLQQLQSYKTSTNFGYLGMVKLLNHQNFFEKAQKYARNCGHDGVVFKKKGDKFFVGFKKKIYQTQKESDIVRIIFGPHDDQTLESFDEETRGVLEKLFPVPFWAWGWDSV